MSDTATIETTSTRLVDCPTWCTVEHAERWDSDEHDGRTSVLHCVKLGRPSPFAVSGSVFIEQRTFNDGTAERATLVHYDDEAPDKTSEARIPLTPWVLATMVRTFG